MPWDAIWRLDVRLKGEDGFKWYNEVRRLLVDRFEPHPAAAALALLTVCEGRPGKMESSRWLKGDWSTVHAACAIVDEHLGKPRPESRGREASPIGLEAMVRRDPILRGLEGTCLDPEFGNHAEPSEEMMGRTELMRSPDLRVSLSIFLLVAQSRLAVGTISACVLGLESLDKVADPTAPALGTGMVGRLSAVCVENRLELSDSLRMDYLRFYEMFRTCMSEWFDTLPAARRKVLARFLPPPVPLDLTVGLTDVSRTAGEARVERRGVTAEPISRQREGILRTVERRFEMLDTLVGMIERQMDVITKTLSEGGTVEFPVGVKLTGAVLRPALEGLGTGRQTTRCVIETAQRLWMDLARTEEDLDLPVPRRFAYHYISAGDRQVLRPRPDDAPPHVDGASWDPSLRTALRVVYVGTHAVEPGGERVEPFWADVCRSRLFDASGDLSTEDREGRDRLVTLIGTDPIEQHCAGMLRAETGAERALVGGGSRGASFGGDEAPASPPPGGAIADGTGARGRTVRGSGSVRFGEMGRTTPAVPVRRGSREAVERRSSRHAAGSAAGCRPVQG